MNTDKETHMSNEIPRRVRTDLMIPGELAIREAIRVVEEAGAHPHLTDVVIALGNAKDKLSDWYDSGAPGASAAAHSQADISPDTLEYFENLPSLTK